MIISVFGGASPKPEEPAYQEAQKLGYFLGKSGHTLLTGGYIGVMEAVSRGGSEAGARVIGATCGQIEKSHGRHPNPYLNEIWQYDTLQERLFALVQRCDAAIAMPGGIGTLAEISIMWNEMIIKSISERPLILFGSGWQKTIDHFFTQFDAYIPMNDRKLIQFAPDIASTIEIINSISK